jgi:signal transduction histidine kinase
VRRIRLVFLLLAVLLLVPMGLLVQRALQSQALEREVSHRAVAERLFDEMERELSRILSAEEERPFADYRFDGGGFASQPYVAGNFQVDPDGSFHTPANDDGALEAIVVRGLRAGREALTEERAASVPEALSVPKRALDRVETEKKEAQAADAAAPGKQKARKQMSPYEAFQSLNKGALLRSERQVKRAPREPARRDLGMAGDRSDAWSEEGQAFADLGAVAELAPPASAPAPAQSDVGRPPAPGETRARGLAADLEADDAVFPDANAIFTAVAPGRPSVEVHPMVGRLIDDEHLLLYRMVLVGEQGYRQGLVLNVPALFRGLDDSVVGGSELTRFVSRDFFTSRSPEVEPARHGGGAFRYRHHFAEPFDALGVRLSMEPLPDVRGAGYLYAIAVLLLISGTAGLLAIYRMVAVTVRFAERRNNFVAAVSHELKTPLTAIRMYAEMLRDGMVGDDDKRRAYYATITAESERLTRLINNVLEFSRLEQGTRETSLVVGAIGPVVHEAAALLAPHAREVGFRIEVEVAAGLPAVRFDRDAVLQVVFNLVDNALKYARGAGNRVIAIRCVRDGERVCVAVRDRGPGVSPRHLAKIFEPFYRGEDELTRTAKGTGIGLALVRGLAQTMGAAVDGHNLAEGGFEIALSFQPA